MNATVAATGHLQDDMHPDRATSILLLLCGDAVYVELTTRHGWSHDQTMDWLVELTRKALLPADPAAPVSGAAR